MTPVLTEEQKNYILEMLDASFNHDFVAINALMDYGEEHNLFPREEAAKMAIKLTGWKPNNKQLASMTGWQIAEHLGCHYSGDSDPINHEGYFYDARDWEAFGYANCVEFWHDPETDALIVQQGTIHQLQGDQMNRAWSSCGFREEDRGNIHAQIDACRYYSGIEPDGTTHPHLKSFKLDDWRERNIWKSVRGWIEQLGK